MLRSKTLTGARQADLDALKAQTATFIETVEKYRLDKATEEAETSMDTAKTDLAAVQKDATDQLAVVDGDTALQERCHRQDCLRRAQEH